VTDGELGGTEAGGWSATLPLEEIRELLLTLGKALRASQLYDENNPVYKRFVQALAHAFSQLWESAGTLSFTVEEARILVEGEEVYSNGNRAESIAFLLYKDGVRALSFEPGFERQVPRFLDVLNRARHAREDDDDLLTLLWEADLEDFRYRYVDLLAEGVAVPEAGPGASAGDLSQALEEARAEVEGGETGTPGEDDPPPTVRPEDFNPTLYAFDTAETERLRQEIGREIERDVRSDVLDALFDRFEDGRPKRRAQIFTILDGLLPAFLARGEIGAATRVLEQMSRYERVEGVPDEERARFSSLLDRVSAPDALAELIDALELGSMKATPAELGTFLGFLRGGALGVLVRATYDTESRELQRVLGGAVESIARRNAGAVVELLGSSDPIVAASAARIVGANRIEGTAEALRELLYSGAVEVRRAAVEAIGALRPASIMGALVETLLDPDADVRIRAARVLGAAAYTPAASRFREILESKEIRQSERTEKIAFFEAYGMIRDPRGVEVLDRYLNGKGFLGRREPSEIRASAALGLGRIGTNEAFALLRKAANDDDPIVRSAVARGLAMREEAEG
jgi:HEAT repeat protein